MHVYNMHCMFSCLTGDDNCVGNEYSDINAGVRRETAGANEVRKETISAADCRRMKAILKRFGCHCSHRFAIAHEWAVVKCCFFLQQWTCILHHLIHLLSANLLNCILNWT